MPKGPRTMLGRILAGAPAIIAPHAVGQALCVASPPPDRPLAQLLVAYCQQVVAATGIMLFGIDRAVQALAWAQPGGGGLCRLDANEHAGRASVATPLVDTHTDGTRV
jgi:hypothetical protein